MPNFENVKKQDIDLIIEVNKKAIEVQNIVAGQNEETIESLAKIQENLGALKVQVENNADNIKKELADKIDKVNDRVDKLNDKTSEFKKTSEEKIAEIKKISEETNKDLFKMQIAIITGFLTLIMQIVQLFIKK